MLQKTMRVVIDDAAKQNHLELSDCQTGVLPVVVCAALLEVGLNHTFAFQMRLERRLDAVKELLDEGKIKEAKVLIETIKL